ncbi:hypothetical protein SEUCBS140593_008956 [Sporothrix eucalyptigena]|uniref:Zn(2)-C6 fungal-type domain-containing protein n=1 Tax=Sporothrix eucalyptigena TaxID=1812306 RepID=A0ABP0CT44_9PEZI
MDNTASDKADVSTSQIRQRHRFSRSRDGCLTCKQRKVKCDEVRPKCSHCERLSIQCRWRSISRSLTNGGGHIGGSNGAPLSSTSSSERTLERTPVMETLGHGSLSPRVDNSFPHPSPFQAAPQVHIPAQVQAQVHTQTHVNVQATTHHQTATPTPLFDYTNFAWDGRDTWQQMILDVGREINFDTNGTDADFVATAAQNHDLTSLATQAAAIRAGELATATAAAATAHDLSGPSSALSDAASPHANADMTASNAADNHRLINYFTHAVTPPILSEVEAQKNWITVRRILTKMAGDSRMVRWAVLAFSNAMLCRHEGHWMASQQNHYENATAEVALFSDQQELETLAHHSPQREKLLATLFFLSYVDILDAKIEAAHVFLKQAYSIFLQGRKAGFAPIEKQLLLWIRLLDARAVSAGGEGLFLSRDNEELFVQQPSPASFGEEALEGKDSGFIGDSDVEDALFQALYQPGIVFFQKVQSFMGHIAKIDQWHRSRGTVEDETEVMRIAATIASDLRALYEQRPHLMDYAVVGKLTAPHISAKLAFSITRAFRTYLSNYYASKIHLHRVGYKNFPLTKEALEALDHIRSLAKLIAESLDGEDPLPINMLWPLVMLGTEEKDPVERAWIKMQLLRMEKIAGNARITTQVLDEVQARQDASKMREDIGTVMRAIFNVRFAIV